VVLHHGRGSDEHDLITLADVLDPHRGLHFVTPRAPLRFAGMPGNHWYVVPRVGYPEADSFRSAYLDLAAFHDALWARTGVGPERTVLGGFSQGTVMSYALGLGPDRPSVAGILAISGFARRADEQLTEAGIEHEYHESDAGHHIEQRQIPLVVDWLDTALTLPAGGR
jgi:phospholipase/carboxylesterase